MNKSFELRNGKEHIIEFIVMELTKINCKLNCADWPCFRDVIGMKSTWLFCIPNFVFPRINLKKGPPCKNTFGTHKASARLDS